MASLWTLLFRRPRHKTYARLDSHGKCLAFKECALKPENGIWVQVNDSRLAWLGQPLPQNARACTDASSRWQPRSLPA